MADTVCPACSADITPADVNMREGAAYCRACDKMWRLSDLIASDPQSRAASDASITTRAFHSPHSTHATSSDDEFEEATADELASREPPRGCWIRDEGLETRIGARCRSASGFFFLFFATFWNSITWLFVTLALTGAMSTPSAPASHTVPTPASTPSVESTPVEATSASTPTTPPPDLLAPPLQSTGIDWFILLFMIPFILIGLLTAALAAVGIFGRCEVTLRNHAAEVFTGVGPRFLPLGWTRRFSADLVRSVNIRNSNSSTNGKPNKHIVIQADNDISLGLFLAPDRRRWLAGALRTLLIPKS